MESMVDSIKIYVCMYNAKTRKPNFIFVCSCIPLIKNKGHYHDFETLAHTFVYFGIYLLSPGCN